MAGKERRGGGSAGHRATSAPTQQRAAGKGNAAARRYANVAPGPRSARPATKPAPHDGPPPDAMVIAVAYNGNREVDRWCGPMDWYWALPMHFVGTRRGRTWTWSDEQAAEVRLMSPNRHGGGILASDWAERRGANRLDILLARHPDALNPNAQGVGPGRTDAESAFDAMFADIIGTDTAHTGEDAAGGTAHTRAGAGGGREAPIGSQPGHDIGTGGLGHRGTGQGASRAAGPREQPGDPTVAGAGAARGHHRGHAQGSDTPSWARAHSAEIDKHGGRTPDEHGERGGSAGGTRGGTGHLLGLGLWDGLIDASPEVAVAVNAALILSDANVTGVGRKLLGRVVRGMGPRALRAALEREAAEIAAARVRHLRRALAEVPEFRELSRAQQREGLARIRDEIEHAFYKRARDFFRKQAEDSELLARRYAQPADASTEHLHVLAVQNAGAYREMERAAVESGGLEAGPLARADGPDGADALGHGPEVDAVHPRTARGAGAVREAGQALTHRHHVLPREHKAWFQERGFPGDDIDNFCIELPAVEHQAIHGGGSWKLARQEWPEGEWNTALMTRLKEAEGSVQRKFGRKLNRAEILSIVRRQMTRSEIDHLPFVPYKDRAR